MSYYGKMRFDKANAEAQARKAFAIKREHYDANKSANCACDTCAEVANANYVYAKQENDKILFARMSAEQKANHIAEHMAKLKRDYPHMYGGK